MGARIRSGLVLLLLAFVLWRLAQPAIHSNQFNKLVQQELASVRLRPETGALHQRILDQGRAMDLEIHPEDVEVLRVVRGYQVSVKYGVPVDLLVYKTRMHFNYVTSTAEVE